MNCKMFGNGNDAEKRLGKETETSRKNLFVRLMGKRKKKLAHKVLQ